MPQSQSQESRPLTSSLRLGSYDNPPASAANASEPTSTPQTRSSGLRRALREMRARDTPPPPVNPNALPMPSSGARRSIYTGSGSTTGTRRRRRSSSPDAFSNENLQDTSNRQTASDIDAPSHNAIDNNRHKRRRLQHGGYYTYLPLDSTKHPSPLTSRPPAIKYGYNGQVAAGRLQLSLVSCDGGEHRDPRHPSTHLGPGNLLRHDKSVYCSERPWANVVLRHKDEDTPFCLERLWVVGPEGGFTAPVREGVVHVAMSLSELRQYIDPPPHARLSDMNVAGRERRQRPERTVRYRGSPERLTLAEALRDPEVVAAYHEIMDDDENEDPTPAMADPLVAAAEYTRHNQAPLPFLPLTSLTREPCERPETPLRAITNNDLPATGGAAVTILTDAEADPGPEDTSPQHVLDYRLQRLRAQRRRLEAENWDRAERWTGMRRLDALMARSRVRDEDGDGLGGGDETEVTPSTTTGWVEIDNNPATMTADAGITTATRDEHAAMSSREPGLPSPTRENDAEAVTSASSNSNSVTTAHFRIPEGKSKVALQFDPPISGRFILLKLWADKGKEIGSGSGNNVSGNVSGNVDIQSVIAVGFGGGRFFPAVSIR